jgi:hypothetical protein
MNVRNANLANRPTPRAPAPHDLAVMSPPLNASVCGDANNVVFITTLAAPLTGSNCPTFSDAQSK